MSSTGYIVWDSVNKRFVAGPFAQSADATAHVKRISRHVDSRETEKKSKDQSSQFTVESVTLA